VNRCSVCGTAIQQASIGRPRRFCLHACRQLAYRQRHSADAAAQQTAAEATALLNQVFRHMARRTR
jgi:predicted nucleic acid-binding Zn ribbon protein